MQIKILEHKIFKCDKVREIWGTLNLGSLEEGNEIKTYVGASLDNTETKLEVIAEALLLILTNTPTKARWDIIKSKLP